MRCTTGPYWVELTKVWYIVKRVIVYITLSGCDIHAFYFITSARNYEQMMIRLNEGTFNLRWLGAPGEQGPPCDQAPGYQGLPRWPDDSRDPLSHMVIRGTGIKLVYQFFFRVKDVLSSVWKISRGLRGPVGAQRGTMPPVPPLGMSLDTDCSALWFQIIHFIWCIICLTYRQARVLCEQDTIKNSLALHRTQRDRIAGTF